MGQFIDTTEMKFNHWTIIKELGGGKVLCECDCVDATRKILYKKAVRNGQTKSCGCSRGEICNQTKEKNGSNKPSSIYIGKEVNGWTAIEKIKGEPKLLCEDKDGNRKTFYIAHFARGGIAEPDYRTKNDLTKQKINHWTVLEELPNQMVKVQCDCPNKTIRIIYKSTLTRGMSKSCGCASVEIAHETMLKKYGDICTLKVNNPREPWQIEVLNNKELFIDYLKSYENDNGVKPNIIELTQLLSVNKASIGRIIRKFKAEDYIQFMYGESHLENELYQYIKSITHMNIERHCRNILPNQYELDIYIPEKKLGIEFNGTYWHSNIFKEKEYHQLKTLMCIKNGIKLIHIFEYEWIKNKDKIEMFLYSLLSDSKNRINARDCNVIDVSAKTTTEFENRNHLQGSVNSSINLALSFNNNIVALMTFGKPRFDTEHQYELLRLCYEPACYIVGGAEKLFHHFIEKYKPSSVISYCDITKFSGEVYNRLGFKLVDITTPNYVWCDNHNNVLTRYQTQKSKLLDKSLGNPEQSESEIMENMGYVKVYNSGNAKYIYNKEEQ